MSTTILTLFCTFFALRLVSLFISIYNEKKLIKQGAVQYGKINSICLTIIHILFYCASLYEAYYQHTPFDIYSEFGLAFLLFAYFILFYVIYELREVWTLKIYIAPQHKIVNSFLFKNFKHPNYFLNVIPELIGIMLLCNAWFTFITLFPIYITILWIRILQENKAMNRLHKSFQ